MPLLRRRPAAGLLPVALLLALATGCGDGDPAAGPATGRDASTPVTEPAGDSSSAGSTEGTKGRTDASTADPTGAPSGVPTKTAPDHTVPAGTAVPADGDVDLVLRVAGSAGTVTQHRLTCTPDGAAAGDHPDPAAACADLYAALQRGDPFQPVGPDVMCTEQYGGPETAEVTGTVGGTDVSASFSLTDGCEISRWEAMGAVLGPFGGTT